MKETKRSEHATETLRNEKTGVTLICSKLDGLLDGVQQVYDASGQLLQQYSMQEGRLEGELLVFQQGIKRASMFFHHGKRHGKSRCFDANGKLTSCATYLNDLLDGPSVTYDATGNPLVIQQFHKGQLQGEQLTFFANGQVRTRARFQAGKQQGQQTMYEANGRPTNALAITGPYYTIKSFLKRRFLTKTSQST